MHYSNIHNNGTKNAHQGIKISLYTQWTATCFGQSCGHLQVCKVEMLDTVKAQNKIMTLSEPVQGCNYNHKNQHVKQNGGSGSVKFL